MAIRSTVYLDEAAHRSLQVRRPFTTSQLIRFWLKVLINSESELDRVRKHDEEFDAILHYVMPKIKRLVK